MSKHFFETAFVRDKIETASGFARQIPYYDLELLYVECATCGRPVVWESGKTTALLHEAEINLEELDASCMLLAETCPACHPDLLAVKVQVVRLARPKEDDLENVEIKSGYA